MIVNSSCSDRLQRSCSLSTMYFIFILFTQWCRHLLPPQTTTSLLRPTDLHTDVPPPTDRPPRRCPSSSFLVFLVVVHVVSRSSLPRPLHHCRLVPGVVSLVGRSSFSRMVVLLSSRSIVSFPSPGGDDTRPSPLSLLLASFTTSFLFPRRRRPFPCVVPLPPRQRRPSSSHVVFGGRLAVPFPPSSL